MTGTEALRALERSVVAHAARVKYGDESDRAVMLSDLRAALNAGPQPLGNDGFVGAAELAGLRADAARYRWLRGKDDVDVGQEQMLIMRFMSFTGKRMDQAIDDILAAMPQDPQGGVR